MNNYSELKELIKKYGPSINANFEFLMNTTENETKINNAIKSFASDVDINNVIALYNTAIFNKGKEGWLFTTSGIHIKETFGKPYSINYSDIKMVRRTKRGKKDSDGELEILSKSNESKKIISPLLNITPLIELIERIKELEEDGKVAKTDKMLIVEDMDDSVKYAYVSYIVNFANVDNEISAEELNRIYSLMVRIKTSTELRQKILQELSNIKDNVMLKNMIDLYCPKGSLKAVYISIIKDMLIVAGKDFENMTGLQMQYFNNTMHEFNLKIDEIKIIQESINLENKYLRGEIQEKAFVKGMKDMGARAAGIGFPIAAIYLSGSVIGLGATGITSGLAALGLGGVLGLSSMVTGIGVVVLIGVAAYSGVKWITNQGERDKVNKREYLIAEAMKKNQETISALIDDINSLTEEFVSLMTKTKENEERIIKLTKKIKLMADTFKSSQNKNEDYNKLTLTTI